MIATPKPPKPVMFNRVRSAWGILCPVRAFVNDSQMHSAWESYARSLSPTERECVVRVTFDDGSTFDEVLEREEKFLKYKGYDGEVSEARYYGKRWALDDERSTSPILLVKRAYNLDKTTVVKLARIVEDTGQTA